MLDTLTPQRYPQLSADPRHYLARVLRAMLPQRLAEGYELALRAVPTFGNIDIAKTATFEARVPVPNGSYLWGLSGTSSAAAGFDVQIRDAGNQAELFGQQCNYANCSGQPGAGPPYNPIFILPKPMLFLDLGEVVVQIWNLAAVVNTIQLLLWFYAPQPGNERPAA